MKITPYLIGSAFLVGLLASIGFWTWTVTNSYVLPSPWVESLNYIFSHTFTDPKLRPIAFWSLVKGFSPMIALLYIANLFDNTDRSVKYLRGSRIVNSSELVRITKEKSKELQIKIAGIPMPLVCEPNHLLITGSTNTGKTIATDEILSHALLRDDRVIVFDPNGHSLARFGKKGDTVLNPFDKRSPGWSIFNELRKTYDFDRFAKSVISDSSDAGAQQWHGYAQQLFAEIMRSMTSSGETTTERLLFWVTQATAAELKVLLTGTAASGLFEPGAEKALASTRFILSHHVGVFKYLQPGNFSLRTWLEKSQGNLYITWNEEQLVALCPLVSAWADVLVASILNIPEEKSRTLWLVLDELASLQRLTSLEKGLTKGRKNGLRVVACLQSISQLDSLYGVHNAKTLRGSFRNVLFLGGSNVDPSTVTELSTGLGESEVERIQKTISNSKNGKVITTSRQRMKEIVVLPSELMNLPPLHGFLKYTGEYPIGKVRLTYQNRPARVKPFVER